MLVQNKKSHLSLQVFPHPSYYLELPKPCTKVAIYSWGATVKSFSLPSNVLKLFKFLEEEWKQPVQCGLWHLQQWGRIGSAGGAQPWEKQRVRGLLPAPAAAGSSSRALSIHLLLHPVSFKSDF